MPHRKPLLVQSGRQPFEVVILVTCVLSGLVGLLTNEYPAPVKLILHSFTWAYGASLSAGAVIALIGIYIKPVASLLVERVGMAWLGSIFFAYAVAVTVQPQGRGLTGAILLFGLGLATIARAITITRDLRKVQQALANPVLTQEEPRIAEPEKGDADDV
jgi:hypothetical protein